MAAHGTCYLPPIVHHLQRDDVTGDLPLPLQNCFAITKLWAQHTPATSIPVQNSIRSEVQRLIQEHSSYEEWDLLAAAQSLLLLLSILLFTEQRYSILTVPTAAQLLIRIWEVKRKLTNTGFFLASEMSGQVPSSWRSWALVSAKRRTIMSLHYVEYSWSVLHGYPTLECGEFEMVPAPAPRYLWYEVDEWAWRRLYGGWLRLWDGEVYLMRELYRAVVGGGGGLGQRGELWLAEVDEFGGAMLSEA